MAAAKPTSTRTRTTSRFRTSSSRRPRLCLRGHHLPGQSTCRQRASAWVKRARDPEDAGATYGQVGTRPCRRPAAGFLVQEGDRRTIRRVSGPLLQDGSFMGRPEPDDSESSDSDESDETDRIVASPSPASQASYTWSTSSLILEGPALRHAQDRLVDIFRRQLLELEPDLGARQLGGRLGATRRRFTSWVAVQDAARFRLQGTYLLERQTYEQQRQRTSQRLEGQPSMPDPPPITGRPRSLRAARFERPGHLHPHSTISHKSLRPRRSSTHLGQRRSRHNEHRRSKVQDLQLVALRHIAQSDSSP